MISVHICDLIVIANMLNILIIMNKDVNIKIYRERRCGLSPSQADRSSSTGGGRISGTHPKKSPSLGSLVRLRPGHGVPAPACD